MADSEIRLDLKDKRLLHYLDFNARASYADLAKHTRLSKQGAEYKLNNLIKKGIVKGFYPIINVPRMGYLYCRLALVLQNVDEKKEKEIIEYAKKNPRFFWIFTTQGAYDLLIVIWAKTMREFKEAISEILSRYGQHIKQKGESVAIDVAHYQHRYLLKRPETAEIHIQETNDHIELDDTDKKILTLLCEDARMSFVRIASHVHLTGRAVSQRIRRMEHEGIIEGYRPIIDHNKLGFTYYKLFINVQYTSIKEMQNLFAYIKENPIVLYIVESIGIPEDLDVEVMVESNQELYHFIRDLKMKFPNMIGEYRTFMFIDTKKVRYLPF